MTVEFALVGTVLALLFAGIIDLFQFSTITRDVERSSAQIANLIASCSRSSDQSCTTNTMNTVIAKQANAMIRYYRSGLVMSMAQISESNNTLKVCAGNMTYLEPDVAASALAQMADKDNAIVVVVQIRYVAMFARVSQVFTGSASSIIRGWTTVVNSSGSNAC
ncbi:hypothetical protein [Methylobacterium terricola]|nr:hypothetical protein [Methylobacterium terricola]